jgi:hypothetical protein
MRKKALGFLTVAGLLFGSCQKDDICAEGTETTPLLQIEFFNAEDPETLKVVQDLTIVEMETGEVLFGPETTNNVAIPLRTTQSFTEYSFIINSDSETENADIVRFDYLPTPEYVNRACGFKVDFLDLTLNRQADEERWIISDLILIDDIENEAETHHISFTH